jgi:hypothetical protein
MIPVDRHVVKIDHIASFVAEPPEPFEEAAIFMRPPPRDPGDLAGTR